MTLLVYKIARRSEWEAARESGVFIGSPDDKRDGFIHLSSASQIRSTCSKHFAGEGDLLLVAFDAAALSAALKWEASRGGEEFPHLYGTLPVSLARSVVAIRREAGGHIILPPEIP